MNEKIKSIMAGVFKTNIKNITDDLQQKDAIFWNSLQHLNLIVELENSFDVSFEPEEIVEMITFEKIVHYISLKTNKS